MNVLDTIPAIMPERFNSISMPVKGSIVREELNSITEPLKGVNSNEYPWRIVWKSDW